METKTAYKYVCSFGRVISSKWSHGRSRIQKDNVNMNLEREREREREKGGGRERL
jgi:hypothetical protein